MSSFSFLNGLRTLSPPPFFQSIWVLTGLPSTFWSMITIIESFQSSEGKIKWITGRKATSNELKMMKILDCSLIHSTGSCRKFLTSPTHCQTIFLQIHCGKIFSDAGALSTRPISTNPAGMAISSVYLTPPASTLYKFEKLWKHHHFNSCCLLN